MKKSQFWSPVLNFEGLYEISKRGQVRNKRGLIIKQHKNQRGYKKLYLSKDGKQYSRFCHRLVAEVFCENSENKDTVNHKDFDKTNNYYKNLEWMWRLDNYNHALINGRMKKKV